VRVDLFGEAAAAVVLPPDLAQRQALLAAGIARSRSAARIRSLAAGDPAPAHARE
jgi:hypothetical protein